MQIFITQGPGRNCANVPSVNATECCRFSLTIDFNSREKRWTLNLKCCRKSRIVLVDNRKGGGKRLEGVAFRALDRFCCCHTVKCEIWHASQPDRSVKSHHRSRVGESVWKRENKSEWKEQHGSCCYSFPSSLSVAAAAGSGRGSLLALLVLVRQDHFIRVVVENGRDGGVGDQARSSRWTSVRQEQLTLSQGCNLKEIKITFVELQTYVKHMDIFTHLIKIDLLKSLTVMT